MVDIRLSTADDIGGPNVSIFKEVPNLFKYIDFQIDCHNNIIIIYAHIHAYSSYSLDEYLGMHYYAGL